MNFLDPSFSLIEILQYAVAVVVLFSVLLGVIYSLWGGFLLITSGGNEEKVKPAVNHIRHAFLGLVVLVIILFVTPLVLNLFGLPHGNAFSIGTVFTKIQEISTKIFSTGGAGSPMQDIDTNIDTLPSDFSDL